MANFPSKQCDICYIYIYVHVFVAKKEKKKKKETNGAFSSRHHMGFEMNNLGYMNIEARPHTYNLRTRTVTFQHQVLKGRESELQVKTLMNHEAS